MATAPQSGLKKARQVRVYLTEENEEILARICKVMPDLGETDVVRILLSTSLRALKDNHYRIAFPMEFSVVSDQKNYRQRENPALLVNEEKP